MTSSDMVMAGITSKIPPDEVIDAMRAIDAKMSEDIRETEKEGLPELRPELQSGNEWLGHYNRSFTYRRARFCGAFLGCGRGRYKRPPQVRILYV